MKWFLLCFLCVVGCSTKSNGPPWQKVDGKILLSTWDGKSDHYETEFQVPVLDAQGSLWFATSIGFESDRYNAYHYPVEVRFKRGLFEGQLTGDFLLHQADVTNLDGSKIYDSEVKYVMQFNGYYAVKLEWTEDDKKSYNASFEIVPKVYEGNHILIRSAQSSVKLVDAGLIYIHESSSDGYDYNY